MDPKYDPYYLWLGIPPEEQPANYYRLLGIRLFEDNPEVIRNAAEGKSVIVKQFGRNQYQDYGQKLLNEISVAKLCLLSTERKNAYDRDLQANISLQSTQNEEAVQESPTTSKSLWRIGSDATNDIVCDSRKVSALHCLVQTNELATVITDLNSMNGTFVNNRRITATVQIFPYDLIVLGREYRLRLPASIFVASNSPKAFGVIGRGVHCDIRFTDASISLFHARYWQDDSYTFLEDLNSTNKTRYVYGEGIVQLKPYEPLIVDPGTSIILGRHQFTSEVIFRALADNSHS